MRTTMFRSYYFLAIPPLLAVALAVAAPGSLHQLPASTGQTVPGEGRTALEVMGRTQCAPGRKAALAPVPLHPVVEVLVRPGDRVKKGQELVKIDADEPTAEVRT